MHFIGIDIGGTKISICIGDEKGNILAGHRLQTQPLKGYKTGFKKIREESEKLLKEKKLSLKEIQGVGISCPGPISTLHKKILNPPNLPGWENAPIVDFFERAFGKKVAFNNDANAAALAEFFFGSFKGKKNLAYLTCSTGMGGGAIINGSLIQGVSDTAMEVGHMILDLNGPLCGCGQRGCFEAYCGGAPLAKRIQEEIRKKKIDTQILKEAKGEIEKIDIACLVEAVKKKDPYAEELWEEFTLRLAQGIGAVLMHLNPEALLLGTIAIHAKELLMKPLRKKLIDLAWEPNRKSCQIEPSSIGSKISELSALALAKSTILKKT